MDALFNNAGLSYLPSACKIVFIKCWTVQNNISTMSHLRWFACPGWPAAAARGPTSRPGAGASLQLLSSPGVTSRPPVLYPHLSSASLQSLLRRTPSGWILQCKHAHLFGMFFGLHKDIKVGQTQERYCSFSFSFVLHS